MKYSETVRVTQPDHPLFSLSGVVYRILGGKVTVLFDRKILYDFTPGELEVVVPGSENTPISMIQALG